jgi:hypothetical protein
MKHNDKIRNLVFAFVAMIGAMLCCLPTVSSLLGDITSSSDLLSINFQDIQPETALETTHYRIEYTNQNLVLDNIRTRVSTTIVQRYSPVAAQPAYQLLNHANRPYLIIRLASGGNNGANWYKVFDLSGAAVRELTAVSYDPYMGLSCSDPLLRGDALEFQISTNCHSGSLSLPRTYWLQLAAT